MTVKELKYLLLHITWESYENLVNGDEQSIRNVDLYGMENRYNYKCKYKIHQYSMKVVFNSLSIVLHYLLFH